MFGYRFALCIPTSIGVFWTLQNIMKCWSNWRALHIRRVMCNIWCGVKWAQPSGDMGATPIIVTGSVESFITALPRLSTDAAVTTDSLEENTMDWFPCSGNEGWYPREAGRQTHLPWVWQLVCPVYRLSQQPHEGINTNVMSPGVTVIYTVWLKSCDSTVCCMKLQMFISTSSWDLAAEFYKVVYSKY